MSNGWIARIKVGDVLKSGSGVLRVVRDVSHYSVYKGSPQEHTRTNVTFAIRHCSWTGRPYTVYTGNDLVQMGYRKTRAKVKLNKKIDRLIKQTFSGRKEMCMGKVMHCPVLPDYTLKGHYAVKCCDVRGIA